MKRTATLLALALALVGATAAELVAAAREPAQAVIDWHRRATHRSQYVPAADAQIAQAEALFERTLRAARSPDPAVTAHLAHQWDELGWRLEQARTLSGRLWCVRERPESPRGQGMYVFRLRPERSIVWQAPHSFSDRHTGEVVAQLFAESRGAAAFFNTAHRRAVDVAHTPRHVFNAATAAVAQADPGTYVIQVHGFAQEKRRTLAGATADFVFSSGTSLPERWVHEASVRVQAALADARVRLYPRQVRELGGTTNAQGARLRELKHYRFLHLEISSRVRQRLMTDTEYRRQFLQPLLAVTVGG